MKVLDLVRHAKAEVASIGQSDHSRSLAPKGIRQCADKSKMAFEHNRPEFVWASDAKRTMETAQLIGSELKIGQIIGEPDLYLTGIEDYMGILQSTPQEYGHIMLVGHNPTMADLCTSLCKGFYEPIKTSSWLRLRFDIDTWAELRSGKGKKVFFWI